MTNPPQTLFNSIERLILMAFALLAFILGVWGYAQYFSQQGMAATVSDLIYGAVGLFLVEFGPDNGKPIPWVLDFARWLAPATLSYAAIKALWVLMHQRMQAWRIKSLRNHAVVFGIHDQSVITVESLCKAGITTVVLGTQPGPALGRLQQCGAYVVIGEPTDPLHFASINIHRARYMLASTSTDAQNIELTYRAYQANLNKTQEPLLHCAVAIQNVDVANALNDQPVFRQDYPHFSAHVIHYPQLAARQLLLLHGPDSLVPKILRETRAPRILCIGAHSLMDEIVVRFASIGFYGSPNSLQITWLGPEVTQRWQQLVQQRSALPDIVDVNTLDTPLDCIHQNVTGVLAEFKPDIIYICTTRPDLTLLWARALAISDLTVPAVFIEFSSDYWLTQLTQEFSPHRHFNFVNPLHVSCSYEHIFNTQQDRLAKAIHDHYVASALAKGGNSASNSSLVPWAQLPESLKHANRNQADHTLIKARLLTGGTIVQGEKLLPLLTPEAIETLAQIEHARWVAEKRLSGWRYTTGPKDSVKRLSPVLVPWHQLPEEEKQKDRDAVQNLPSLLSLWGYYQGRNKVCMAFSDTP
jgi:hypothetical protein